MDENKLAKVAYLRSKIVVNTVMKQSLLFLIFFKIIIINALLLFQLS